MVYVLINFLLITHVTQRTKGKGANLSIVILAF